MLDLTTLSTVYTFTAILCSVALVVAAVLWRSIAGPAWWAASTVATASGAALFTFYQGDQTVFVAFYASVASYLHLVFTYRGIELFLGKPASRTTAIFIVITVVGIAVAAMLTYGSPVIRLRAIGFASIYSILVLMLTRLLLNNEVGYVGTPRRLAAAIYGGVFLMVLFRGVSAAFEASAPQLFSQHTRDAVSFLVLIAFPIARTFIFGLMVAERLQFDLASLAETYRRESEQDPLTGLPNRLRLFETGERTFATYKRYHRPLAVVAIDVDYFKQVNDQCGHDVGDRVLRAIADLLSAGARETDLVARYGGEEFVLLLPETEMAEAAAIAERLREGIANLEIPNPVSRISASFGVARAEPSDETFEALLGRADQALYAAKDAGRNRVTLAPEQEVAGGVDPSR